MLAVHPDGRLLLYRGAGGSFQPGGGQKIGTGWASFTALLAPGDWNGDGHPDLLARASDGRLLMYRGNGTGGFFANPSSQIGSGWQGFTALLVPGDFSGDGRGDILARKSDGALLMYRGDAKGGFVTGTGEHVGSGWQGFTALLAPGDWSGDGKADVLARAGDGKLFLYRGDGDSGFIGGAQQIGSGWQGFTAMIAGGDFSGDGEPDILARNADGLLFMYRGNGTGGFVTGKRGADRLAAGARWTRSCSPRAQPAASPPAAAAPAPGAAGRAAAGRQRQAPGRAPLHPARRKAQGQPQGEEALRGARRRA